MKFFRTTVFPSRPRPRNLFAASVHISAFRLAILLLVLVLCVPVLFAQSAPTPPFNQCPPVGADTSCAILIEIDKTGSLRVFTDPTQGPYDTIEDTLIGVQNDSSNSINAIPLSSGAPIFGFDGDGVCGISPVTGLPYVPAPSGCPFGATGYEGQTSTGGLVSFTVATTMSGLVNFPGGLQSGQSAYFSLEGAIQTQCPAINAPSRLAQGDSRWAGTLIGNSKQTIGAYGCFLTDVAMEVNFYAAKQNSSFRTDPATLNTFLTPLGAFDAGGNLLFSKLPLVGQYAAKNGVTMFYNGLVQPRNDFVLDEYLCNGQAPILKVGTPHWVLSTGQTTQNGVITYSDIDPDSYPGGNTLAGFPGWNNTYSQMILFSDTTTTLAGLYVEGHSPVELLLTAPDGSQTGFNPITNTSFDSIPSSGYGDNQLADDDTHGPPLNPDVKELVVIGPTNGTYGLQVFGTGSGPFTLDVTAYDTSGNSTTSSMSGNIIPGITNTYSLGYSSTPGSSVSMVQTITIAELIATLNAAAQGGFIDNQGVTNSLLQKLQAASAALSSGNGGTAINILNAFNNEVSAQSGKHIAATAASLLMSDASLMVQNL